MKQKPLSTGQTVRIKAQVKQHGGRQGTVVFAGKDLGWRVVKVKFDDSPLPVSFAPEEVEQS